MAEDQIEEFLFICAGRCTAKENECFHGEKERVSNALVGFLSAIFFGFRQSELIGFSCQLERTSEKRLITQQGASEQRSQTRSKYQSERSTFGGISFGLQS